MKPQETAIELRKVRDIGEVLGTTFAFLRIHFLDMARLALVLAGPVYLIGVIVTVSTTFNNPGNTPEDVVMTVLGQGGFWGTLLVILSSIIFGITVFIYMGAYTAGTLESLSTGALIRQTLRGIARAVGLYLPFGLFMALFLFPLMIVPVAGVLAVFGLVVYGAVILTMGYAALIIENRGIGESVRRAVDLLKGLWWQTFGLLVTLAIQTYLFMIVILIPLVVTLALTSANTPEGTLPFENIGWVAALASFLYFSVAAIMQMVFNIAIGVQYFNLSERKEMTGLLNKLEAIEVRIEEPLSDPPTAETEPGSGV